jgi:hypothetical protein
MFFDAGRCRFARRIKRGRGISAGIARRRRAIASWRWRPIGRGRFRLEGGGILVRVDDARCVKRHGLACRGPGRRRHGAHRTKLRGARRRRAALRRSRRRPILRSRAVRRRRRACLHRPTLWHRARRKRSRGAHRLIVIAERPAFAERRYLNGVVGAAHARAADRGNAHTRGAFRYGARIQAGNLSLAPPRLALAAIEIMPAAGERDQRPASDGAKNPHSNATQHARHNARLSVKDYSMLFACAKQECVNHEEELSTDRDMQRVSIGFATSKQKSAIHRPGLFASGPRSMSDARGHESLPPLSRVW